MNSGILDNPFVVWGRYRKKGFKYYLPISFQFHHTKMDGAHAGRFLENLQREINGIKLSKVWVVGLFLMDLGYTFTLHMVFDRIHKFGFRPEDIKYIIKTDWLGVTVS